LRFGFFVAVSAKITTAVVMTQKMNCYENHKNMTVKLL